MRDVVVLTDGQAIPANTLRAAGEYEALMEQASPDYEFVDFDENTKAATFYTSGTTGDPKGVYYSHRQIVLHDGHRDESLRTARGAAHPSWDVYMPLTSMFHALAWGFPFIAMTLGLKMVLPGPYLPEDLLKLRESEKVTLSHCVPTIVQMLLAEADTSKQDLAGWTMIIGGAAPPPALCRAAREKGIDIFAGSGMSETGPVVTLAQIPPGVTPVDADDDVHRRSLTGRPAPFVALRVVDEGMRDVPRDGKTQGEIVLRSPFSTQGYLKNPQASEDLWAGGYLHSQDAAVIAVKDEKWGERPMAFVVAKPDAKVDADAVRAHLLSQVAAHRISKYAVPEVDRIACVSEIPKTSVGKINKKLLRERNA